MVSGYSPPCSRVLKTNPVPSPQGSCGRFSGVISSNSWVIFDPSRSSTIFMPLCYLGPKLGVVCVDRGRFAPARTHGPGRSSLGGDRSARTDRAGPHQGRSLQADRFGERLEIGRLRAVISSSPVTQSSGSLMRFELSSGNVVGLHVLRNRCSVVVLLR